MLAFVKNNQIKETKITKVKKETSPSPTLGKKESEVTDWLD